MVKVEFVGGDEASMPERFHRESERWLEQPHLRD